MDKQGILNEIKRTAEANGGVPLGTARFLQETGIREADWGGKFWVRWGDALREAGLEPNLFNQAYDTKMIIEKFVSLIRELGKFPVRRELQLNARQTRAFRAQTSLLVWVQRNGLPRQFWTTARATTVLRTWLHFAHPS